MEKPIMFRNPRILLTSETKYINIADMRKISVEDLAFKASSGLAGTNGSWYEDDKAQKYYLKRRQYLSIILNEILGVYLSRYMQLDTIDYDLAYDGDNIIGLFSKNFRKRNIDYVYYHELMEDEKVFIDRVLLWCAKTDRAKKYKQQYTDYLMRNFYANQGDRVFNVLCQRKKGLVYLSTLYDYEISFFHSDETSIIDPFLMSHELDYDFINRLRKKDKCFDDSIEKVLEFNMDDTLDRIRDDFKVRIPDMVADHYITYDKERKRLMKENLGNKK